MTAILHCLQRTKKHGALFRKHYVHIVAHFLTSHEKQSDTIPGNVQKCKDEKGGEQKQRNSELKTQHQGCQMVYLHTHQTSQIFGRFCTAL
jgi:hypothetical protein